MPEILKKTVSYSTKRLVMEDDYSKMSFRIESSYSSKVVIYFVCGRKGTYPHRRKGAIRAQDIQTKCKKKRKGAKTFAY